MANIFFGGGLNERDELNVSPEECIEGQNFILDPLARTFRPRPPFDLKGTAPNGGDVSGIMQLIKRDDSESLLVTSGAKVYSVDTSFTFTEVNTATGITTSTGMRGSYWSLDDKLVITDKDKNNRVHEWDGSTFQPNKHGIGNGTVTTATGISSTTTVLTITKTAHGFSNQDLITISNLSPSDWNTEYVIGNVTANTFDCTLESATTTATGAAAYEKSVDLYAKYSVVWNNRVWLFNITTDSTDNPHMILASQFENADVFDTTQRALPYTSSGLTGNEAFFLLTPDMRPINGVAVFYNTIIISTVDGKLFKLTGSDSTDYQIVEYYPGSAATGSESIVNTGNDVYWMKKGGRIDSLSAVEQFGDVKADDVSRWIPSQTRGLSDSIAVYDEQRQLVCFFVTNKVLVLDKDMLVERPEFSPWTIYKTKNANLFNTNAAVYMRDSGDTGYDIYWGDSSGNVFKLNGTAGNGDAGTDSIVTYREHVFMSDPTLEFANITGRVEYRRRGSCTLVIDFDWAEQNYTARTDVPLDGAVLNGDPLFWNADSNDHEGYWGGTYYWNQGSIEFDVVSNKGFSPAGKGRGFFIKTLIDTKVDFLVNRLIL